VIHSPYVRWLGMAALADWLITRTLSRAGIFIPKTPIFIRIYQALTQAGLFASTLGGVLALGFVGVLVWRGWQLRGWQLLSGLLALLAGLSILFLVIPPGGWPLLLAHLALLGIVAGLGVRAVKTHPALSVPVLAYLLGGLYQTLPGLYEFAGWVGPPSASTVLFNAGELLVVASGLAFWWMWGRGAPASVWVWAAVPAVLLSGLVLSAPSMAGIMTIWSTGLTLYLPWPVYLLSLWLVGVTVIYAFRNGTPDIGWAVLFMIAGGYAPQLSTQIFYGLIGLWLVVGFPGFSRP